MCTDTTRFRRNIVALATVTSLVLAACGDDAAVAPDGGWDGEVRRDASAPRDAGRDGEPDAAEEPDACPDPVPPGTCEAVAGGTCYYVDPENGDDDNPGTYDEPWKTFVNVNKSIYGTYRPDGWVELQPGDVLYLLGGLHTTIYHPGDDSGPDGGGSYVIYMRQIHGEQAAPITIKGYPGTHPVVDPAGQGMGILIAQSEHVVLEGIEIRNAYGRGIRLSESQDVEVRRVLVHDTDGPCEDNVAGLEVLASRNVEVSHSVFHDNYDRTAAAENRQTENSCNMVLFSASNVTVHHCIFYQSQDRDGQSSGCGLKFKHASRDPGASFEVSACYFENHKFFAIGTGTAHSRIHHNIINGAPVALVTRDFGGPTHQWDQEFAYNTIYDARGLLVSPTLDWVDHEGGPWPDVTELAFHHNVIYDLTESYNVDRRTVLLGAYMSDELYEALRPNISFAENCYYNPNTAVSFGFAESVDYGPLGGSYTLSEWQAEYGYDQGSLEADPAFADPGRMDFSLGPGSPCRHRGALTGGYAPPLDKDFVFACEDRQRRRKTRSMEP